MKTLRRTLLPGLAVLVLSLIAAQAPARAASRASTPEAHGDQAVLSGDQAVAEIVRLPPELSAKLVQECKPPELDGTNLWKALAAPVWLDEEPDQVACNCLICAEQCYPCTFICQPNRCHCFCNLC